MSKTILLREWRDHDLDAVLLEDSRIAAALADLDGGLVGHQKPRILAHP